MAWYEKLHQALLEFEFSSNKCDYSIFVYRHHDITLYSLVYVDNIILTGTSPKLIHDLISKIHNKFFTKETWKTEVFSWNIGASSTQWSYAANTG